MAQERHQHTLRGTVVRVSGINTIKVATKVTKVHPLYHKRYSQLRHFIAHDPNGTATVGQEVTLVSCRPISRTKHWCVQA